MAVTMMLALGLAMSGPDYALESVPVEGYRSAFTVEIAAPIEEVFEAATGDVTAWWDHSFATDPAQIVIEAHPGGHFYEVFEAGKTDGAIHADVIYVQRPTLLRLHGPLGLSGRSYDLVSTWQLAPGQSDGVTQFTVNLSMHGEINEDTAGVVTQVWHHFIAERLKVYVEAGCHLDMDAPCMAFD
ncbi:SRPBCC family protein [Woodsholea maritima]|uniref:SRPBCC family protein n=1 Tax=Woodsholea maritima TaxID=240237 RepID=UPI00037201C9|nr:SRPBCC domain-containing protein [Woodsholea maritima]